MMRHQKLSMRHRIKMTQPILCPLCQSEQTKLLDTIDLPTLLKRYRKLTQQDFSYLFAGPLTFHECQDCALKFFDPMVRAIKNFTANYKTLIGITYRKNLNLPRLQIILSLMTKYWKSALVQDILPNISHPATHMSV